MLLEAGKPQGLWSSSHGNKKGKWVCEKGTVLPNIHSHKESISLPVRVSMTHILPRDSYSQHHDPEELKCWLALGEGVDTQTNLERFYFLTVTEGQYQALGRSSRLAWRLPSKLPGISSFHPYLCGIWHPVPSLPHSLQCLLQLLSSH